MANKENKGGFVTNDQVEQDLKARGKTDQQGGYQGLQDTGDDGVRALGTEVQKANGLPAKDDAVSEDE